MPDGRVVWGAPGPPRVLKMDGSVDYLRIRGDYNLVEVEGLALARDGSLLIANTMYGFVVRVAPDSSSRIVAGKEGVSLPNDGDGGLATDATLAFPSGLASRPDGGFLIADTGHNRVRIVGSDGRISTVVGTGQHGFGGDGGSAVNARLRRRSGSGA